jgi:hypothetical protein
MALIILTLTKQIHVFVSTRSKHEFYHTTKERNGDCISNFNAQDLTPNSNNSHFQNKEETKGWR